MIRSLSAALIVALPLSGLLWLSGAVPLYTALGAMAVFAFVVICAGDLLLRAAAADDMPPAAAWVLGIFATASVAWRPRAAASRRLRDQGAARPAPMRRGNDDLVRASCRDPASPRARTPATSVDRLFHSRRRDFAVRRSACRPAVHPSCGLPARHDAMSLSFFQME
jgi:hypothetical protein